MKSNTLSIYEAKKAIEQKHQKFCEPFHNKREEEFAKAEEAGGQRKQELEILDGLEQHDQRLAHAEEKSAEFAAYISGHNAEAVDAELDQLAQAINRAFIVKQNIPPADCSSQIELAFDRIARIEAINKHSAALAKRIDQVFADVRRQERENYISQNEAVLKKHGVI